MQYAVIYMVPPYISQHTAHNRRSQLTQLPVAAEWVDFVYCLKCFEKGSKWNRKIHVIYCRDVSEWDPTHCPNLLCILHKSNHMLTARQIIISLTPLALAYRLTPRRHLINLGKARYSSSGGWRSATWRKTHICVVGAELLDVMDLQQHDRIGRDYKNNHGCYESHMG